jgi:hypothetical protein
MKPRGTRTAAPAENHFAVLADELVHPPIRRSNFLPRQAAPRLVVQARRGNLALTLGCGRRSAVGPIRGVLPTRRFLPELTSA